MNKIRDRARVQPFKPQLAALRMNKIKFTPLDHGKLPGTTGRPHRSTMGTFNAYDHGVIMIFRLGLLACASSALVLSPPPAVADARGARGPAVAMASKWDRPQHGTRYGTDPRNWRRLKWWFRFLPSRGAAAKAVLPPPGEVGRLRTLKDLSAIIAHGGKEKQFVCLKFTREDCKGCKQSEPLFAERAAQHTADGLFFEVHYEEAKQLVKSCGVRAVPVSHIYARGVRRPRHEPRPRVPRPRLAGCVRLRQHSSSCAPR